MKRTFVLVAALAAAACVQARATTSAEMAQASVAAVTNTPAGWAARFDRADADSAAAKVVTTGMGLHFTTGPSATWYRGGEPVDGMYRVQATFTQTKAPTHPESYGLMLFGRQMETPTQSYFYFMVRGDGKWALKHRANDTDVHTLMDWTASPAVVAQDAAGKATNTLAVDVAGDSVRFLVNSQVVQSLARSNFGGTPGVTGIRMNHGLDVDVTGFAVTKK